MKRAKAAHPLETVRRQASKKEKQPHDRKNCNRSALQLLARVPRTRSLRRLACFVLDFSLGSMYNGSRQRQKERKKKGAVAIQYVYRPYHPWRHGYKREKRKKRFMAVVKLLFVLELFWFFTAYIKSHTVEQVTGLPVEEFPFSGEDEVYGIGIGTGEGSLFWFHSRTEVLEPGKE